MKANEFKTLLEKKYNRTVDIIDLGDEVLRVDWTDPMTRRNVISFTVGSCDGGLQRHADRLGLRA